jgi:hypothetical protein
MYVTAQKVRSRSGDVGINAYVYVHRDSCLPKDRHGAPDLDTIAQSVAGYLVAKRETVTPGGNHVLAYMDVAAPDKVPSPDLDRALAALRRRLETERAPASHSDSGIATRFANVEGYEALLDRLRLFDELRAEVVRVLRERREPDSRPSGPYVVHAGHSFEGLKLWLPHVTLERLPDPSVRRSRVVIPTEVLQVPGQPFDVLRETAKWLLGVKEADIEREGGIEILNPRTATVFATFTKL